MSAVTLFVHLREHDSVVAEIGGAGAISIDFGPDLTVFIDPDETPEHFARFCKMFGLQKETAPGDQTEDGVSPAGNEPEREGAVSAVGS